MLRLRSVVFSCLFLCFISSSFAFADSIDYTYDDLNRLTQMSYGDGYVITDMSFTYDDVGNITYKSISTQTQDSDSDLIPDGWESTYGLDPEDPNDASYDTDSDDLTNLEEYNAGTDPTLEDTDGDSYSDGLELAKGTDPLDAGSYPAATSVPALGFPGLCLTMLLILLGGFTFIRQTPFKTGTFIFLAVLFAFGTPSVKAEVSGPGWIDASTPLVDPDEAWEYYQSRQNIIEAQDGIVIQGDAAIAETEIVELARALQHDPVLIYEYVKNHVDYVPYFGSLKGATLTYIDGAGNDFDQASLMIALLRESGYTARYVYGQMWIPGYGDAEGKDMQHWLGTEANNTVISQVLSNGGIPASYSSPNWVMDRVWVEVEIDSTTVELDPAFKVYESTTGIDLKTAMGYSQSALLSAAGGTTGTGYIESMNESSLQSTLDSLTMNLVDYIRNNTPNAYVHDIIGGRSILPLTITELPTQLDFSPSPSVTWTDIPDVYSHKVSIQHGQIDETFNIADLSGKRLSLTYREGLTSQSSAPLPLEEESLSPSSSELPKISQITEESPGFIPSGDIETILPERTAPGYTVPGEISAQDDGIIYPMSGTWDFGKVYPEGYSQGTMSPSNSNSVTITLVVSLSSNPTGAFSITSGSGSHSLSPGQSLPITVRLTGTGQSPGSKSGQLRIEWWYNGSRFADDYTTLTGSVAYPLTIGGYGMSVGSYMNQPIDGTCRLENNGALALTINSMSLAGANPSAFQFLSGNGSGTVSAGSYRDIGVRYLATTHGTQTASIYMSLTYDGMPYTGNILNLQGQAYYAPDFTGSYGFNAGQRYLGDTVDGTCRIVNNGSQSLSLTGFSLTGDDPSGFSIISGNTTGTLSSGQYRDVTVRYLADAAATHSANLQIAFTYDGLANSFTLGLAGETLPTPVAQLWLDDVMIFEETEPVTGSDLDVMTLSVDHPYSGNSGTYCDQSVDYHLKRGSTYSIIYDFGGSKYGHLLTKRQRSLQAYKDQGLADDSREMLTETLNVMGMTWMRDTTLDERLLEQIAGVMTMRHHRFGVVAQESGYYIDVKAQLSSTAAVDGDSDSEDAFFKSIGHLHSAMEHGVLEQMQVDRPAASTVKLLQLANDQGSKIFEVTSANFSGVSSQLTGYSSQDLADFQTKVNDGATLILPQNGQIPLGDWAGKGYIDFQDDASGKHIGMIIGGDYYGGYGGIEAPVAIEPVMSETNLNTTSSATDFKPQSTDPVDMASGSWMYSTTDLSLSGGKGGLSLSRSYYSSNNTLKGPLGYGWSHNYHLYAEVHSNSEFGLGRRTPIDAAALITASVVTLDILSGTSDAKDWMVGALTGKWAMDRLIDKAVSVHLQTDVLTFLELPDGSYSAPPGVTSILVKDGAVFRVDERFDNTVYFDTEYRVTSIEDADGNQITFTYSGDNLSGVSDDFGHSLTFTYTSDLLTSVVDSAGRSVSYTYDGNNNLTTYHDPENKTWTCGYDSVHRIVTLENPLGITTVTNVYDDFGRVKTQTVPRQTGTVTYNLYFSGYRNIEEDADGNQTIYHFDDNRRLIAMEDAQGNKAVSTFDGQNHTVIQTDPRNNSRVFTYDGNHNVIKVTDPLSKETLSTYDSQFRLTDVTDPLGNTVHTDYDTEHHPIATTVWPTAGHSISTGATYYTNGQVYTQIDGKGIVTTLTYDSYGNPETTQTATEPAITYDYNHVGRMVSLTDQVGSETTFTYSDRNLLLSRTDPLLKTAATTYYDDGKVHTVTDRNNETTTYTYTPTGKVDTVSFHDGSSIVYTYDGRDNLVEMQDDMGLTTFSYDEVNRLTSTTDANNFTVAYAYDENGNVTQLTYPGNKTVSYTYDALNRIETVTIDWLSQTATYIYDDAGRLTYMTQFNGTVTEYTYDNSERLTDLENRTAAAGSVIAGYHFTLDDNGNRIQTNQDVPLALDVNAIALSLAYNSQRNRLVSTSLDTFSYDDEGQISSKSADSFAFDSQHRLTAISGSQTCQYAYNGSGKRLQATRNGTVTRYIYDAQGNLIAEADGTDTMTRYYIYGAGLLAMATSSNNLYCYHFDATGHTVALTDGSASTVNAYNYTPFGTLANSTEIIEQPFTFVGEHGVMAEPNGWLYMRARYFDPNVGRFVSEDPIGFDGGDVNLYAYVLNNPIIGVDPMGMAVGDWWDFKANYKRAREISNEELNNFAGHHNDQGDAMRHATWSKRTTEETNKFTAWSAGVAHEIDNLINDNGPWRETLMDLHNNKIGRQAAGPSNQINQTDLRINPQQSNGCYR